MDEFGLFPSIYPEELVYSLFARYHVKSGNMYFRETSYELFGKILVNLETEFISPISDSAKKVITKNIKWESVILTHTMFCQYARFMESEQRKEAFVCFEKMKGSYSQYLTLHKKEEENFLRYCPLCVKEDRERYGETYWHTKHQLRGIHICPTHHCRLYDSTVGMSKKKNSGLTCAENEAVDLKVVMSENTLEIQLAEYVWSVFQLPIQFDSNIDVSDFICSRLEGTKYLSTRGEQRKMSLLTSDFLSYFEELPQNDLCIKEEWQIQKIFTKNRKDLLGICQLAMFLGIQPREFENMSLPKKSQQQLFDAEVRKLRQQGIGYNQIARMLGVSQKTVRNIFVEKKERQKGNRKKSGAKQKDWSRLDRELLPKVEKTVERLYGTGAERPRRIQVAMIQRYLNLPTKCFDKLPLCRQVILSKEETQEEYWAREIIWAVAEIEQQNIPLCWRRIRERTNMKKEQFVRSLTLIDDLQMREKLELLL